MVDSNKSRKSAKPRIKPTGRPTKLNQEVCDILCENVELGMPFKFAAEMGGISYPTFLSWKAKGEALMAEKAPSKYTIAESNYVNFFNSIQEAEAKGVQFNLKKIREIGLGEMDNRPDWKALSWLLKCQHPEHFGDLQKIDQKTEHSGGVSIQLNMKDCSKKGE